MVSASEIKQALRDNNLLSIAALHRRVFNAAIDRNCSSCLRDAKVRLQSRVNEMERETQPVVLYVNTIANGNAEQQKVAEECLWQNQNNPHINKVVELKNEVRTFRNYFDLFEENTLNIIANPDIIFDNTLHLARQLKPNQCYALTPYLWNGGATATLHAQTPQAAWLFRGRIKKNFFADLFPTSSADTERIAREIKKAGYMISNPYKTIHALKYTGCQTSTTSG